MWGGVVWPGGSPCRALSGLYPVLDVAVVDRSATEVVVAVVA